MYEKKHTNGHQRKMKYIKYLQNIKQAFENIRTMCCIMQYPKGGIKRTVHDYERKHDEKAIEITKQGMSVEKFVYEACGTFLAYGIEKS